ncbi:MAG: single-stranded DNA-binding protein [Planctomycetia bacterium]|nr:single-stranded DNA-binding protein [Planctomycetia bacterium]
MLADNSFQIIGTVLHKEPMKIIDKSGLAVLEMEIETTEMWKNNQGGWEKKEYTLPVSVFGEKAKNCSERLPVGTTVRIAGKIRSRTKEARNGGKFLTINLVADEIQAHTQAPRNEPPKQTKSYPNDPEMPF